MFKGVQAYLKDNPQGYWFKAKLYGWGWTPARWQGWVTLLLFIALLLANAFLFAPDKQSDNGQPVVFALTTIVLVAILIFICYKKGERPHWQWGLPERYKNNDRRDDL